MTDFKGENKDERSRHLFNLFIYSLLNMKKNYIFIKIKTIVLAACVAYSVSLDAQDIHFSQYELSPLTLNPALTGAYEGTFRVGAIYRDQWASVLNNQYTTPAIYGDLPVIRGWGKNDWFGAGMYLFNDKAGSAALTNLTGMLSLAYHLGLGDKSNTVLSFGAQAGIVQKKVNQDDLLFEDQIIFGTSTSGEYNDGFDQSISYSDLNVGALVNVYLTSRFNFYAGTGIFHLNRPNDGFLSEQKLSRRGMIHLGANYDLASRKVFISPSLMFQTQAKARELITEIKAGYHFNPERNITLNGGLGFRYSGAGILRIGMDYKGAKVGIAYDFDFSPLNPASRGRGAYELALSYTAKIYKTPVVKPVLFCPRF